MANTTIRVINNGPLRIEGEFCLNAHDGAEFGLAGRNAISLCRCGHSANKPFCDGTHNKHGFESTTEARDLPPMAT